VLYGVREGMRESERSLQFSKEWGYVVAVFIPCTHLILSISLIFVHDSRLQVVWVIFLFRDFWNIFARFFICEFEGVFLLFLPNEDWYPRY
jgi:hypothetical protein